MKKRISLLLILVLILSTMSLTGCGKYSSSYTATMLVTTQDKTSASMHFSTFNGSKVFKLKTGDEDMSLRVYGKLEKGNVEVYCDFGKVLRQLLVMDDDSEFETSIDIPAKSTLYILIESKGEAQEGKYEFELTEKE
ncbi:MAG: hypothetical protein II147_01910 [Lachnospiraceae bacterium]|nr:hypothetical protein [Lachnospiraceae bacterium]